MGDQGDSITFELDVASRIEGATSAQRRQILEIVRGETSDLANALAHAFEVAGLPVEFGQIARANRLGRRLHRRKGGGRLSCPTS